MSIAQQNEIDALKSLVASMEKRLGDVEGRIADIEAQEVVQAPARPTLSLPKQ